MNRRYSFWAEKDFGTERHAIHFGSVLAATAKLALAKTRRRYRAATQVTITGGSEDKVGWIAPVLRKHLKSLGFSPERNHG